MSMNELMEESEASILHTYNRFPVVFEKGEGCHLYDSEGKEYLDFGAGIAVFALGYHYADYDQALKDQIDKVIHTSNLFYNVPMMEAAEKLVILLAFVGVVVMLFGYFIPILWAVGAVIALSSIIPNLLFYRCLYCGRMLGKISASFCPHCGKRIDD